MTGDRAALVVDALQALGTILWASIGWVAAATALATVLVLATATALRWMYTTLRNR
ncbi:hypothetical protein ACIQJX_35105 [Streptomyces griseoviridis]